ncbi:MAG: hypothetical protein EXR93_09470 [Gemmatimonadetes bacterium]|nr:hypothetical protein [Gemmatimonadota bacterium]
MPPKPLPPGSAARLKRRFRLIIDEAFDGNLSMAARELGIPVSTVHKYYQTGPRRLDARVAQRIEAKTKLPIPWVLGMEGYDDKHPKSGVMRVRGEWQLQYPPLTDWRVQRVLRVMEERLGKTADVLTIFLAPLKAAEDSELTAPELQMTKGPPLASEKEWDRVGAWARQYGSQRAHLIHVLCEFWERTLDAAKVAGQRNS